MLANFKSFLIKASCNLFFCLSVAPLHQSWILCYNCIVMLFFMPGSNVQVFCPIMLYKNPNWAGCFSTHSRRTLTSDIKTMASMTQKHQHVGNAGADIPYMLMIYLIFVMFFISNDKAWRNVNEWRHMHLSLDLYQ